MALISVNDGFTIETLERLQKINCAACHGSGRIQNGIRPGSHQPVRVSCRQCAGRGYVFRENQTVVRLR